MRLSLRWIFDHINLDLKNVDVKNLLEKFNSTTAEVDNIEYFKFNIDDFTLAVIEEIGKDSIKAKSLELKKNLNLPLINENIKVDQVYLVKKEKKNYNWALLSDLGSTTDRVLVNLNATELELKGEWKESFEREDYILTINNIALTNRPDLWGHRGIAREIAAILGAKLIPDEQLLTAKPIKHYAKISPVNSTNPFTVEIDSSNANCGEICKRFASLFFKKIENRPSEIFMASRLARVDSKPMNFIVDTTNYVMFDLGQPMHSFDAETIKTHKIVTRCAKVDEELTLLDGDKIELNPKDYVITDGAKPISLAGIIGGLDTAVNLNTKSIFLESANFDARSIRLTSMRIKKRTEASARFEKNLDPNQNTQAILRYLKLLNDFKIDYQASDSVSSIGALVEEKTIEISQDLIIKKIGVHVSAETIEEILIKLGFGVQIRYQDNNIIFSITIPTYRATKDITIEEDIVEEIARFIGFSAIPLIMPTRAMLPVNVQPIMRIREIKKHLAYGMGMHEVQTYAFFDEDFLKEIDYKPKDTLDIANPQSQNYRTLISSLIPNLLKCIYTNRSKSDSLRFFEYNRVWFEENKKPVESLELAGIFFEHKKSIDFYDCKSLLDSLFNIFKIKIDWNKITELEDWYNPQQTAQLLYKDRIVGTAGKINLKYLEKFDSADAFIFELDGNFLLEVQREVSKFEPLEKYPEVNLDLSLLVPLKVTVAELQKTIKLADERVKKIDLIDFYSKEEWSSDKSLTFRITLYDKNKTMTKEEIDLVYKAIVKKVQLLNGQIR